MFCTFAFQNKAVLNMLKARAAKLADLKTCKMSDSLSKIEAILNMNSFIVDQYLGGASDLNYSYYSENDNERARRNRGH